ncbi:DUF7210 family protein [Thalassolituus oleivorans]|uniref:DUF7210 family protein n=1 Tax=Thalassolituus oleivorans TaxID=187493 RepID=UPI0023F3B045|nr:hypothetical protein [Thalassolituus oleivorans]
MASTKTIDVTLAKAHTHAGKAYAAGDKINVREATASWLKKAGVVADNAPTTKPVKGA